MDVVIAQHILGLRSPRVTEDELRAAWRRFARDNHPDRRPDDPMAGRRFAAGHDAYETLRGLNSGASSGATGRAGASAGRAGGTRARPTRRGARTVVRDDRAGRARPYDFSEVPGRVWWA